MDSQSANEQLRVLAINRPKAAPKPVVCRVCMHVNPADTPVCRMCCNDLFTDADLDTLFAKTDVEETVVETTPEVVPAPIEEVVAAEEATPYVEPVFEDDDEAVVPSKKVERILRKLDAEVAKYKIKADVYEELIAKEKRASRKVKNEKKLAKLTVDINKVIDKYRKKLLCQKYDLPLYPWEVAENVQGDSRG